MSAMPQEPTTTKRGYTGLKDYAEQHNGTEEMFLAAGWQKAVVFRKDRTTQKPRPALAFKTTTGTRYRFIDGERPTYDQEVGYVMCWYGLHRAIDMAKKNSLPFIVHCNGAASTIPAQAKGVPAFSLQSGEGAHPKPHLMDELKAWKGSIIVALDCDEAGRKAAITVVRDYRKAGFNVVAVDMAMDADGADLADFVALHDKPIDALLTLEHIPVPELIEKPKTTNTFKPQEPGELYEMARRALYALNTSRIDIHDDWIQVGFALSELGNDGLTLWDEWSRSSQKYKPGHCAARWKTIKPGDGITLGSLFEWANQDYGKGWQPERTKPKQDTTPKPKPDWLWTQGLPFGIRAGLNAYSYPAIAPVLELWVEAINTGLCESDEPIDVEFLKCVSELLNRDVSEATIRRGLNQGTGQFLANLQHYNIYNTPIDSSSGNNKESDKTARNTSQCQTPLKAGRKAELYQLLPTETIIENVAKLAVMPILEKAFPLDDDTIAPIRTEFLAELCEPEQAEKLSAALSSKYDAMLKAQPKYNKSLEWGRRKYRDFVYNLNNPNSHPLPKDWTYKNATEYQAACARAIIEYNGGDMQFSRPTLTEKIGCTLRNLNTVLKRAGIYMLKNQFVDQTINSVSQLRQVKAGKYSTIVKGFPVKVTSTGKKPYFPFANNEKLYQWADAELKAGHTLTLQYRQANRQSLTAPAKPALPPDEPKEYKQSELPKPLSALVRFFIARAFRQLIDWLYKLGCWIRWVKHFLTELCKRHLLPKERKPSYAERWVGKLAIEVAPVIPIHGTYAQSVTGEILDTPQSLIDVLVGCDLPQPRDPLVDALAGMGCKITEVNEVKDANNNDIRGIPKEP